MKKSKNIIYWIATLWLALGMLSTGAVQLFQKKDETEFILDLGYPPYFLTIIGAWKLAGVLAIFIPGKPVLREWAYSGFFFLMSGAVFSHLASGSTINQILPALLLLMLTLVSWIFKPRNFEAVSQKTIFMNS